MNVLENPPPATTNTTTNPPDNENNLRMQLHLSTRVSVSVIKHNVLIKQISLLLVALWAIHKVIIKK